MASSATVVLPAKALSMGTHRRLTQGTSAFSLIFLTSFHYFLRLPQKLLCSILWAVRGKMVVERVHSWQGAFVPCVTELWGTERKCNVNVGELYLMSLLGRNQSKYAFPFLIFFFYFLRRKDIPKRNIWAISGWGPGAVQQKTAGTYP